MLGLLCLLALSPVRGCVVKPPDVTDAPDTFQTEAAAQPRVLKANYIITSADDFIVEIYQNGRLIPDAQRHMLSERFGATAERIDVPVYAGDWLVFHVVNNRLRWGGAYYFAAAGCFAANEFGFVSSTTSGKWSYCDEPKSVGRFISDRDYLKKHSARSISRAWAEGGNYMHSLAGDRWDGTPVWGEKASTWVKALVD